MTRALDVLARSISTSYKDLIDGEQLGEILRSGIAPDRFHAHLITLLDETPLPLVFDAVAEAATREVSAEHIMKHLVKWAQDWKVSRAVW